MINAEDLVGPEWAEWFAMTPQQRWAESERMWQQFLALGGSLDPDPDPESPFYDPDEPRDGRPIIYMTRRGPIYGTLPLMRES